jgi:hypothetical protein
MVVFPTICVTVAGGLGRFDLSFCAQELKAVNNNKPVILKENRYFMVLNFDYENKLILLPGLKKNDKWKTNGSYLFFELVIR